jgi:hypothetical protein
LYERRDEEHNSPSITVRYPAKHVRTKKLAHIKYTLGQWYFVLVYATNIIPLYIYVKATQNLLALKELTVVGAKVKQSRYRIL